MIQTISNFFSWLQDFFLSVYHFIESFFTGLFNVLKSIPQILSFTTNAIGYLPSALTIFAILTVTISIVYLIVGRDTGG